PDLGAEISALFNFNRDSRQALLRRLVLNLQVAIVPPVPRLPARFLVASVNLLKKIGHDAEERAYQSAKQEDCSDCPPQRGIRRQAGLKVRRDQRHAAGNQREQKQRARENIEVARHRSSRDAVADSSMILRASWF